MNKFEFSFHIDEKAYYIYIDSSKDEWKKISINNIEIVNEKYTLALNKEAYIIYYPIDILGNQLVISIDDNSLIHKYNIYLNKRSLIDDTLLDEQYIMANSILKKGFSHFLKNNWFIIFKENLLAIVGAVITFGIICNYTLFAFSVKFLLSFIIVPLAMPAFIAGEWFHNKNVVKKYKNCFRPKIKFE